MTQDEKGGGRERKSGGGRRILCYFPSRGSDISCLSSRELRTVRFVRPAAYAPLHKAVRGVQPIPAAKDKVTLRNCFPWDEAKLALTKRNLFSPRTIFSPFHSSLSTPFAFPFSPTHHHHHHHQRSIRPSLIPLHPSFLSTSFRRDARRQKATAPQRAKESVHRLLSLPPTLRTDYFVTIAFSHFS